MVLEKFWSVALAAVKYGVLVCWMPLATAAVVDAKGWLEKLNTLESRYTQRLFGESDELLQSTEGQLTLSVRPLGLLIQESKPMHLRVIFDGQTLWQYDEELSQVIQYSKHDMLDAPLLALFDHPNWTRWKQTESTACEAASRCYDLMPPSDMATFKGLRIGFSKKGVVSELHLLLPTGERNVYLLDSVFENRPLAPKTFKFSVPSGVDWMKG